MKIFLFLFPLSLFSQLTSGLICYYPFDKNYEDVTGNTSNEAMAMGRPEFKCGPSDNGLLFDGRNDYLVVSGAVTESFTNKDFTVSFFFKPLALTGTNQYLFSKSAMDCNGNRTFDIRYDPNLKTVSVFISENAGKRVNLAYQLKDGECWQHLVVTRRANIVRLYINERPVAEGATGTAINLTDDSDLYIGSSSCAVANIQYFRGLIDEVKIFNRALDRNEVTRLSLYPDQIATSDTLIFLGQSVQIAMHKTCGNRIEWTPVVGVNAPQLLEPIITPPTPGLKTYRSEIRDDLGPCIAVDEIIINVIDPSALDCSEAFLPSAFTPNGDGLNDSYGISNPYALQDFKELIIEDRWGKIIFQTTNAFEKWDGTFNGQLMNPGIVSYRLKFECNGEEIIQYGTATLLH
jgi:gliding motility-associated-like protein